MTEAIQEPSPFEKLQAEFNQACARYGFVKSQMMLLEKETKTLEDLFVKINNKAANISKKDQTAVLESQTTEEVKNGTEG